MTYQDLIRMVRVARALELKGQYNTAKLLWAAVFSEEVKASSEQGVRLDTHELASEMQAAIQTLKAGGANPDFVAALKTGRDVLPENRTVLLDEIPPVFVCRVCGNITLEKAPAQCPNCDSHEISHREVLPFYFLESLSPQQALAELEAIPGEVEALLEGLSEDQLRIPEKPGEWSMRGAVLHCVEAQALLATRVDLILTQDNPSLAPGAAWNIGGDDSLTTHDVLAHFRESRYKTVATLKGIAFEDWWRIGYHQEFGTVTVLEQASYFAKHDRSHFPQMIGIRAVARKG